MKLINKDTDYAVKALLHIARNGGRRMSVAELAGELDIPYPFLRKTFQGLSRRGILTSSKGKGGGFELVLPPEKIYLTDLINIFHGPVELADCVFKDTICPDIKTCPLRKRILKLQKIFLAELRSITIASLLEEDANWPLTRSRPS
ncbi:MAG: Rrf2 family transcriptional regulator [Clostridiales bacterium]|nr:Rrf2 family transcriptional regulator [Clostridiales bacterium]